jgi:hypothetical protein
MFSRSFTTYPLMSHTDHLRVVACRVMAEPQAYLCIHAFFKHVYARIEHRILALWLTVSGPNHWPTCLSHIMPACAILVYAKSVVCMYVCMCVYTNICMYVCVYVCMYVCMYVYTNICMYVCVYVCMYVCAYANNERM